MGYEYILAAIFFGFLVGVGNFFGNIMGAKVVKVFR